MNKPIVLLVDDQPANLFALEAMLAREDLTILTARSGKEALELLLVHEVALAILDVQMPEMDGFELATLMRGVGRTSRVPIIFVTAANSDQSRIFQGYEAGAVDFLFKPIETSVLRSKVDVFVTLEKQRRTLEENEQRFRGLVLSMSQAVAQFGPDGRPLADCPAWRALTGQGYEQWMAGRLMETVHPEERDRVRAAWEEALATQTVFDAEFRVQRPAGSFTWTHFRAVPILDRRGRLSEWAGALFDIQERKHAERLRELFMGILGHDLRNPLGAMLTSTQLVMKRTTDEHLKKPLERVLRSGERMVRMIEQLLDVTRIRLGEGVVLSPVQVDLTNLVDQVLVGAPAGRERFEVEALGDTRGHWDADRLFQVVANLAGNAGEHSRSGPIHVRIDGRASDHVELRIHNDGPPVPPEVREAMFEPFHRVDELHKRNRGLGLGLYISKQFVVAHGGSISVESSEEQGTAFNVSLPRHEEARP